MIRSVLTKLLEYIKPMDIFVKKVYFKVMGTLLLIVQITHVKYVKFQRVDCHHIPIVYM